MTNAKYESKIWKKLYDRAASSQQPHQMPPRSREERKADALLREEEAAYMQLLSELGLREEAYQLNTNGCW